MSGGKPNFNFNPSGFKFDFGAPAPGGQSDSSEDESGSSSKALDGQPKGAGRGGPVITAEMLAAIQAKIGSMVGMGSGLYQTLPKAVKRRIAALEGLHEKYEELNEEFEREIYLLEKKYEALYKPLYTRRSEIVTGQSEPTEAEVEGGAREEENDGPQIEEVKEGAILEKEEVVEPGVPNFWLGALQNFDEELIHIEETDEPLLQKLIDISCENFDEQFDKPPEPKEGEDDDEIEEELYSGFKLTFKFALNDYFTNETLTMSFFMRLDEDDSLSFDHSEASKIDWKPGKNLTVRVVQKQVGGGGRGGKRGRGRGGRGGGGGGPAKTINVEEPTNSFFNFFTSLNAEDLGDEEEEENEAREKAEMSYETGEALRTQIIPRAVLWYLGEGRGPSPEELMEMMGADGSYDEEEDGDFDPKDAKAPECKQQ